LNKTSNKLKVLERDPSTSAPILSEAREIYYKDYYFFIKNIAFEFEYIIFPKFLMRNSSIANFNFEKYNYDSLLFNIKDFILDRNADVLWKKSLLHAIVIGYTINFRNITIQQLVKLRDELSFFVEYFETDNPDSIYSQDFAYFVGLMGSKLYLCSHQNISDNESIVFNEELHDLISLICKKIGYKHS
jgi:hypothetical protein